ncbi:MAG: hypothetical protein Q4F00_09160 [bacterium]|nr:hypothetical protein [bacterium]
MEQKSCIYCGGVMIVFVAVSAIVWSCLYYKWEQDAKKNFT